MDRESVGRRRWLLHPLGVVLAWFELQASTFADPMVLVVDIVSGLALLGGAYLLLGSDRGQRVGSLSALTGIAWFMGSLDPMVGGIYLGPLAHLIATYPTGRTRSTIGRSVVAAAYAGGIAQAVLSLDLRVLIFLAAVAVSMASAVRARDALRRGRLSGSMAGLAITLAAAVTALDAGRDVVSLELARVAYALVVGAAAMWLAIDLRWGGWSQDALTKLVIDLGNRAEPATLRGRLAEMLDDPTLVLGYRVADGPDYIDDAGRPVALPGAGSGRTVVPLTAAGTEVGVIVRDELLETDPVLASGVAQAAELALANARLNAATRQQLDDLDASRTRLIAAADAERSRIRTELGGGALRRLGVVEDRLAGNLDDAGARRLLDEVRDVIEQLDEFAQGLGAGRSLEGGLRTALRSLIDRSPVPVDVEVSSARWTPSVEATVYFVVAEALTNIARHANATRASLRVAETHGGLRVEVADDGMGGAKESSGSGLEGLRLRVEATGGRLRIEDRDGGGTRLTADLALDVAASLDGRAPLSRGRSG